MDRDRADRLYMKAMLIQEGKALGVWLPIIQRLAHSGHTGAMVELAAWQSASGTSRDLGRLSVAHHAAGIYRRAYRQGDANAAQHLAMSRFNLNDLAGYRDWLGRTARLGDKYSAAEQQRFETRLPHEAAKRIRRHRPWKLHDL